MSLRAGALAASLLTALGLACAKPPPPELIPATPIEPLVGEEVAVDHVLILLDSSGSISQRDQFPEAKALYQSFMLVMPDGSYEAGAVSFGGLQRESTPITAFDRDRMVSHAKEVRYLSNGTPLYDVLSDAEDVLSGQGARASVVIFTDGLPTDPVGRDVDPRETFDAARTLAASYDGTVCYHTVQIGEDAEGGAFLRGLSKVTACGSFRRGATVNSEGTLQNLARAVFIGAAPPPAVPVAARVVDTDGDGVPDGRDACPGTPAGAPVDARGCWVIPGLNFASESSEIDPRYHGELDDVARVLSANPGIRVRIDGHTDASGATEYNEMLSERRARAVRDYLVSAGIAADRVDYAGLGESRPIAPNSTREGRAMNRRTEVTVLK